MNVKHKYSKHESIRTIHGDIGFITDLETSRIDNNTIPSYWILFSKELHPDGYPRNIWEETILDKCYTQKEALALKTDLDVLRLPKRIYYDSDETRGIILNKLNECHLSAFTNKTDKFIQT